MKYNLLQLIVPISFFFFLTDLNPTKEKIISGITLWKNTYPQEKVFLQIDRTRFVAGEFIWFKATCTYDGKPTFLSRILYVTLTNSKGKVIDKKMYKINDLGSVSSSFEISKQWASDNYSVNAYTLWMLNFPDYIAKKPIYIYGSDYAKTKATQANLESKILIDFFPEGGDLIEGINQKCAFKITNEFGYPVALNAKLVDEQNNEVASLTSLHDGMGSFEIEPKLNKTYAVNLANKKGRIFKFNLPQARKEGIALSIQNANPNKLFALVTRGDLKKEKYNQLIITAHINGKLVFISDFNFEEDKTATAIPKKNLPSGIMQITVFDSIGNPLAERIAFIDNYTIEKPKITIDKKDLLPKALNEFSFTIDSLNKPNLSVLVKSNIENNPMFVDDNIASSLLLTSDLKGYIHQPGYYFSEKSVTKTQHLDLIMMTNGWRRFDWKQTLSNKPLDLKYPIESNISIKGKVFKSDRKEAVTEGKVTIIIKGEDSSKILIDAFLTDKGEFIVDSVNIKKAATLFYEGTNAKKQKLPVDVKFYENYIDSLTKQIHFSKMSLDTNDLAYRSNEFDTYLYNRVATIDTLAFGEAGRLRDVIVYAKKRSRVDSVQAEYVSPMFEMGDQTLDLTNAAAKGYVNIWQYLRQFVPGINVDPFQFGGVTAISFSRFDGIDALSADGSGTVKFFLNEIEVDPQTIDLLNVDDIALVKVYKGSMAVVFGSSAGAIAIYTKKGATFKASYEKAFDKRDILGYTIEREFFNPTYKNPTQNTIPDKRITLLWKGLAKEVSTGKYNFTFYNNDLPKGYTIIIQGIDANGKLIYEEKKIE